MTTQLLVAMVLLLQGATALWQLQKVHEGSASTRDVALRCIAVCGEYCSNSSSLKINYTTVYFNRKFGFPFLNK